MMELKQAHDQIMAEETSIAYRSSQAVAGAVDELALELGEGAM